MHEHLWVLDVFDDVREYLDKNKLPEAGLIVNKAAEAVAAHLAIEERRPSLQKSTLDAVSVLSFESYRQRMKVSKA